VDWCEYWEEPKENLEMALTVPLIELKLNTPAELT